MEGLAREGLAARHGESRQPLVEKAREVALGARRADPLQRDSEDHLPETRTHPVSRRHLVERLQDAELLRYRDQRPEVAYAPEARLVALGRSEPLVGRHRPQADLAAHRMLLARHPYGRRQDPGSPAADHSLEDVHSFQLHHTERKLKPKAVGNHLPDEKLRNWG